VSSASYDGRHRPPGRHRAPARRVQLPRGLRTEFVLPSAAAAALVVSATGATVVQSSPTFFDLTGSVSRTLAEDAAAAQYARIDAQQQRELQARALAASAGLAGPGASSASSAVPRIARSADRAALAKQTAAAALRKQADRKQAAAALAVSQRWVMPIQGATFTSGFGWRWGRMHQGNDFGTPVGTPVAAMSTGTVVSTGYESGYGNQVEIRYWDGTVSLYAHLSEIKASVGDQVAPGQIVALSGNTGHSTGPHLHLEIHPNGGAPINPAPWLHAHHLQ
jgi:murein DD-endopeptidase MepM/ murein hydrolase activator NlpD